MGMFGDRSRKVVSNQNDIQAMELDLFRMQMMKIAREDAQKMAIVREAMGITESLRTPQQVTENIQRAQGRGDTTTMVDVTGTPQGQLSNPEPLFEMSRQIREQDIQVDELPIISTGDATVVESQPAPEMPLPASTTPAVETQTETPASTTQQDDSWLNSELDTILESEGGFQNDSADSGNYVDGVLIGTNRGITPAALAEYRGVDPSSITVDDIRGVTEQEARDIYKQNYYLKPRIDELPEAIQASVFDMNINAGRNSIKILQRLVGVEDDGVIGPQTIAAVKEANITPDQYADARIEYYRQIVENNPSQSKFLNGWIRRANKYREE